MNDVTENKQDIPVSNLPGIQYNANISTFQFYARK